MTNRITQSFDGNASIYYLTAFSHRMEVGQDNAMSLATPGRTGYQCLRVDGNYDYIKHIWPRTPYPTQLVCGMAYKCDLSDLPSYDPVDGYGGNQILCYDCVSSLEHHLQLIVLNDGSLGVQYGINVSYSDMFVTSVPIVEAGVWYYIEMMALIHDTAGYVKVHVNGSEVINLSGVRTRGISTTDTTVRSIRHGTGANFVGNPYVAFGTLIDDFYANDTAGSVNNTFEGPCSVQLLYPAASGAYAEFSATGSLHYEQLDEHAPASDAPDIDDYVGDAAQASGLRESYVMSDLLLGTVSVAALNFLFYTNANSVCYYDLLVREGTTDTYTPDIQDNIQQHALIFERSIVTLSSWTVDEVNNSEFGFKGSWSSVKNVAMYQYLLEALTPFTMNPPRQQTQAWILEAIMPPVVPPDAVTEDGGALYEDGEVITEV